MDNQFQQGKSRILMSLAPVSNYQKSLDRKADSEKKEGARKIRPWLEATVIQEMGCQETVNYKFWGIILQAFVVNLDDLILSHLINYRKAFHRSETSRDVQVVDTDYFSDNVPYYFGKFLIHPMKFIISLDILDGSRIMGIALLNVEDCEIKLSGYEEVDRVFDKNTLINRAKEHYTRQLFMSWSKLLGSSELLFNLGGLVNSFHVGLQDFWYEPQEALMEGDLLKGVYKGGYSLLTKSVVGVTKSIGGFTDSVGSGIAQVLLDSKYVKERASSRCSKQPNNAIHGMIQGAKSVVGGVSNGLLGIVDELGKGTQKYGPSGLFYGLGKGVGKGLVKSVVGVTDGISDIVTGVQNTLPVSVEDRALQPARDPRMFYGPYRVIRDFNEWDATFRKIKDKLDSGKFKDQWYEGQFQVKSGDRTWFFILELGLLRVTPNGKFKGFIKWEDIVHIRASGNIVVVRVSGLDQKLLLSNKTKAREISKCLNVMLSTSKGR